MMSIGSKIRKIRLNQKLTQQEVADKCDFTKSLLSKIESGKTVPPVATLLKIADALGVRTSTLLDDDQNGCDVVFIPSGKINGGELTKTNKGYSFFSIANEWTDKAMLPFLFSVKKGEVVPRKMVHRGEEFLYMLEGRMKYTVGASEYELSPGDCLYFSASREHDLCPISDEVRYLAVFSEGGVRP